MRFVSAGIRVALILGLGLVALAIGLGRMSSAERARTGRLRRVSNSIYLEINDFGMDRGHSGCHLVDTGKGRAVWLSIPDDDVLWYANSSPWTDENGESQLVGRWESRGRWENSEVRRGFGLARYSFPSGRPLDHVELEIVPAGTPCWFPGTAPRVLFAGMDGGLYRFSFEEDAEPPVKGLARPLRLSWKCTPPGDGEVRIHDPSWPTDPRLHGWILVSLSYLDHCGGEQAYVPTEPWWLRLDADGSAIIAAGRVQSADPVSVAPTEMRMPHIAATPDGALALAYLARPRDSRWQLRLARVETPVTTTVLRTLRSASVPTPNDLTPNALAFSPDGRWVYIIHGDAPTGGRATRFPVNDVLNATGSRPHSRGGEPLGEEASKTFPLASGQSAVSDRPGKKT